MTSSVFTARRRLLLAGLAAPWLAACGKKAGKGEAVARGATVLAFGDSVTFGTGAGAGEDWPSLLGRASGWKIVNAGIPGDTAEAGKERLPAALQEHRPALTLIEIGGNDFLRRRPAAQVKADLRTMLGQVRAAGSAVVLVAVPELSFLAAVARKPSDSPIYAELGQEEKVPVIENVFSGILGRPELCSDQIHPNAAGYREMAARFTEALKQLGVLAA